jgi:hypothetical protein
MSPEKCDGVLKNEQNGEDLNTLLSLTLRRTPQNPIARRSEFFGKCRITTKISKHKGANRQGRMGRQTLLAEHAGNLTARSNQISNAYRAGLVPRKNAVAVMSSDGVVSLSSRDLGPAHANIFIQYLEQLCVAARMHASTKKPDPDTRARESPTPRSCSSSSTAQPNASPKLAYTALRAIILNDNRLNDDTGSRIVAALQNFGTLEKLDMSNNYLGTSTAMAIGNLSRAGDNLHCLALSGSLPRTLATSTLMGCLSSSCIRQLDLSHNRIGHYPTIKAISDIITHSTVLTVLELGWNNFGPSGGLAVCHAVLENKSLEKLDLSFNNMGSEAIALLAEATEGHSNLTNLNVSGNNFGDEGALELSDAMSESRRGRPVTDCVLNLQHNHLTRTVADALLSRKQTVGNTTALARHNASIIEIVVYPLVAAGPYQGSIDPIVSSIAGY